ncbi:pyridoxal phosphate-dependent transferase [Lactifluus volemus]|nr:pyridoxal phosphate-dependent transferase [Lactifluus volemus]
MATPNEPPPAFGHQMRQYFSFEENYVNLNTGSYGSVPIPVSSATENTFRSMERNIDRFLRLRLSEHLNLARHRMARFVGAGPEELVFVPNASHGLNTVLRNLVWNKDDIIIIGRRTGAQYISDLPPHPSISTFELNFPTTRASVLQNFRVHVDALNAKLQATQSQISNGPKLKIVAIIDSISSRPGAYLPWKEMVAICREGNCHKWLFAKRACAILYVPERNQHLIRDTFPTSHAYVSPKDFQRTTGNLFYRDWLGGEEKISRYCRSLALSGGRLLSQLLGTQLLDPTGEFTLNMVNVWRVSALIFRHDDRWWVRVSAQIWNEALQDSCKKLELKHRRMDSVKL